MTVKELWNKVGHSDAYISTVLARSKKWNEEVFTKIWLELGLPIKKVNDLLHSSLFEAIEQEYWVWFAFALKSQFWLSEGAIKDVMKFITDVQKKEANR